jgi:hypothetical protein
MRWRRRQEESKFFDPAIGSLQVRAWLAGALLLAAIGAAALSIDDLVYDLHARYLLRQELPALAELYQAQQYLHQVMVVVPVVALVAVVTWLTWQGRAHANLSRIGASGLRFRPASAVASWFVPLVNLVLPFMAMRELWRASDPETGELDWRERRTTIVLPLWWMGVIATAVLFTLGMRLDLGSGGSNTQLITRDLLFVACAAVSIATALLAGLLIKWIDDRQIGKSNRVRSGAWVNWTNRERAS